MKAIICEMCGSSDLIKTGGLFLCQNCGTKYTVEEAKKLLGTVKIDKSEETENLMILADRALSAGQFAEAAAYYEQVLRNAPNNCDAIILRMYCDAMQVSPEKIVASAEKTINSLDGVFSVIANVPDSIEMERSLDDAIHYILMIANTYMELANKACFTNTAYYSECVLFVHHFYEGLEILLKRYFPYDNQRIHEIVDLEYKNIKTYGNIFNLKRKELKQEIKRLESELKAVN